MFECLCDGLLTDIVRYLFEAGGEAGVCIVPQCQCGGGSRSRSRRNGLGKDEVVILEGIVLSECIPFFKDRFGIDIRTLCDAAAWGYPEMV